MTPEEKQRAQEIVSRATPGEWRYENLNWVGSPLFAVFASSGPADRGKVLFDNIEPDSNSYNNIEFIIAAHNQLPKMLQHIEALENNLIAAKKGAPQTELPALTVKEIAALKELFAESTQGAWSWEDDQHLGKGVYTVYAGREPRMHGLNLFGRMDTGENAEANLDFITEAHQLVPKALARIDALETGMAQFRKPEPKPRPKPPAPPWMKPPAPGMTP
jgi:hypothetical protein